MGNFNKRKLSLKCTAKLGAKKPCEVILGNEYSIEETHNGEEEALELVDAIKCHKSIKVFSIGGCSLDDEGIQILAEAFANHSAL